MKRFYTDVAIGDAGSILLDGRPVQTPARRPLALPTTPLAEGVAQEWRAQGEKVDPRSMPLTGLANAAIDHAAPDPLVFAARLAKYGEGDLLCYRADGPDTLVAMQAAGWDPILGWARRRYDIDFVVTDGILHQPQPAVTVERLAKAIAARGPFELAGLSPIVTIGGSLVVALALIERAIDLDTAWAAVSLDERFQAERWGEDAEAAKVLAARRADFAAAKRFMALLDDA